MMKPQGMIYGRHEKSPSRSPCRNGGSAQKHGVGQIGGRTVLHLLIVSYFIENEERIQENDQ